MIDTLLMFSGGLDSTGAFWKLIQDKQNIHVHHMHLKNVEKRLIAESKSTSDIIGYMKNISSFTYSESTHEYPSYKGNFIWDGDLASFIAGSICTSMNSIKKVAFGRTATDDANSRTHSRIERANKIFNSMCDAVKIYPVQHLTKTEIYEMLPQELRELTWSCRTPLYKDGKILPCKYCITCHSMLKLGIKQIPLDHNQ
jgi:7-cyano-7-deazaguanine synthase in queuosine biosynthesis